MLSRFVSLKEQRAKTLKVSSEEDVSLKNKELVFTKLKSEYEVAVSLQAKGEIDSALCIYQNLVQELKKVDFERTKMKLDENEQYNSFQNLPFDIRLHFLCLKNSAYICEEKGYWEQVESFYSVLAESFWYCVILDTGLVVRMLRTLKKLGDFSFARKICECYLLERKDKFLYREWHLLIHTIGDELVCEWTYNPDDDACSSCDSVLPSPVTQEVISFEAPNLCKIRKPSYFITDKRTLLLWIFIGAFYDSGTVPFDFRSQIQLVDSHEYTGILDTSGNLIFPVSRDYLFHAMQ
jgi:hypothetical protein